MQTKKTQRYLTELVESMCICAGLLLIATVSCALWTWVSPWWAAIGWVAISVLYAARCVHRAIEYKRLKRRLWS